MGQQEDPMTPSARVATALAALAAAAMASCTNYITIQEGTCAQACLGKTVGICPTSLVVSKGHLKDGTCADSGYDVEVGFKDVKAGPCGHINFTTYNQSAQEQPSLTALDGSSCTNYITIQEGTCAQACLGKTVGICPTSLVVSKGHLKDGTCADSGYDVKVGFKDVKAGPCGHINFTTYNQSAQKRPVSWETAVGDGQCPVVSPVTVNLTEFVRSTWYIRQQQLTGYQPVEDLFCVSATYGLAGAKVPFFRGEVISVYNYANAGHVNGKPTNDDNKTVLCARVEDKEH